jgi:hypothetical protein
MTKEFDLKLKKKSGNVGGRCQSTHDSVALNIDQKNEEVFCQSMSSSSMSTAPK